MDFMKLSAKVSALLVTIRVKHVADPFRRTAFHVMTQNTEK
jgi:hypothetical protein